MEQGGEWKEALANTAIEGKAMLLKRLAGMNTWRIANSNG
jgi:hypothetical protein